ncbi:MAG: hypothetical protein V4561_03145 [Bacteroidota bacterium]
MKKSSIVILLFALVNLALSFSQHRWARNEILKYDASGYYLYLPAVFVYNDLGEMDFYDKLDSVYRPSDDIKKYGLYSQEKTKLQSNKYPIGTAIAEMPFFLIAHLYTQYGTSKYPIDGYSEPYQFSVGMSNILWSVIGLWVLGAFLRRFYNDSITALTLLIIGFGTNLFCYTHYEMGMSHALLFMLVSCVLFFTERWYATQQPKHAILLGIFLGWIIISRPVDVIIVILPLLWYTTKQENKWLVLWQRRKHLLYSFISFLIVSGIQLMYWKYSTGNFIHFAYQEEGFNFNNPQIVKGLFSFEKGWFVYTPIAFISFIGLFNLWYQNKKLVFPIILFFILSVYLIFSWHTWSYGWGFGTRPMIEFYPVLSIPLAALLVWLSKQINFIKAFAIFGFGFFVWLNLYQTEQYKMGAIKGAGMNQKFYWRVWNKMHPSPEDWKYYNN